MGFSNKTQVDSGFDSDKWVITGISIRASLKPVNTRPRGKENNPAEVEEEEEEESCSTTPTARESRIPDKLPCPPAPRKRRPKRCNLSNHGVREFFTPPDLEAFFKCYAEKAN